MEVCRSSPVMWAEDEDYSALLSKDEELEAITLALQAWRPIEDETLQEEDRVRWSNVRRHLLHDLGLTVVTTP